MKTSYHIGFHAPRCQYKHPGWRAACGRPLDHPIHACEGGKLIGGRSYSGPVRHYFEWTMPPLSKLFYTDRRRSFI